MAKAPVDLRSLARAHTAAAIKTLAGIMNQPKAQASARVTAANSLLDRGWGKPEQNNNIDLKMIPVVFSADDEKL